MRCSSSTTQDRSQLPTGRRRTTSVAVAIVFVMLGVGLAAATPASANGRGAGARWRCQPSTAAGDQTIVVDGATVPLYVPNRHGSKPIPLVLDLHGSSSSGLQTMAGDGIRDVADTYGFAVVAPNGAVPFSPAPGFDGWAWNIPGVPLVGTTVYPPSGTRDDVQFLSNVIDAVAEAACIDTSRVYATGISGGGRMASQLACDLSHKIAAIAPVVGVRFPMTGDNPPHTVHCQPSRPVPVLAIHGAWDPINVLSDTPPPDAASLPAVVGTPVPGSSWSYSAETAVQRWAAHNKCRQEPHVYAYSPNIDLVVYRGCRQNGDVKLIRLKNSGHGSPGHGDPALDSLINPISDEIDGTVVAWQWMSRYRLSGRHIAGR